MILQNSALVYFQNGFSLGEENRKLEFFELQPATPLGKVDLRSLSFFFQAFRKINIKRLRKEM